MKVDTYRGPVLVRANYQYVIFLLRENRKIFSFLQENLTSPSPIVWDGKFVFSKTESWSVKMVGGRRGGRLETNYSLWSGWRERGERESETPPYT